MKKKQREYDKKRRGKMVKCYSCRQYHVPMNIFKSGSMDLCGGCYTKFHKIVDDGYDPFRRANNYGNWNK